MMRYAGIHFVHVDEEVMADLHEYLGSLLRSYGIQGEDLDYAIADCVRVSAIAIEKRRANAAEKSGPVLAWTNPAQFFEKSANDDAPTTTLQ